MMKQYNIMQLPFNLVNFLKAVFCPTPGLTVASLSGAHSSEQFKTSGIFDLTFALLAFFLRVFELVAVFGTISSGSSITLSSSSSSPNETKQEKKNNLQKSVTLLSLHDRFVYNSSRLMKTHQG